jgi:hypothetical protein
MNWRFCSFLTCLSSLGIQGQLFQKKNYLIFCVINFNSLYMFNIYFGLCGLVEQTTTTQKNSCLVVCIMEMELDMILNSNKLQFC